MIGNFPTNKDGSVALPVSSYQPTKAVQNLTDKVKQDYTIGFEINNRPWTEFNNVSLLTKIDDNQKKFNVYTEPVSDDPEESWRWPGVRPHTRNKVMSLAAHLTSSLIFPNVFAQNESDEEDRDMANIMRDLVKWHILNTNYGVSFVFGVVAALVNPMTYFHIEYVEAKQTIKTRDDNGEIVENEVLDDEVSGIKVHVVPADEILIANPYQFNMQRQRFIIRRRFIDMADATQLYSDHPNWKHIQPGIKSLYNAQDGMFYDQVMEDNPTQIEEAIYYNRVEDLEVPFVNGIYMGEKAVNANPIKHRDNKNKPKYAYVPIRYEPFDEGRFFFSRSAVDKMAPDQDLMDTLWRETVDAGHLMVNSPLTISGTMTRIPPGVMMPGAVTPLPADTKVEALGQKNNMSAGLSLVKEIEQSISESSQAPQQAGQETGGATTAFEVSTLQQNARVQLGLAGKMIIGAVKDLGDLLVDLIVKHQTVGQVEEIIGGGTHLNFQKFLLPDEIEDSSKITKKIDFSEELIGMRVTDEELQTMKDVLTKDSGGVETNMRVYKVNPRMFANLDYKLEIEADVLLPKNEQFEKALNLEAYDRMILDPFADQRAVARDFLYENLKRGESDKYMIKGQPQLPPGSPQGAQGSPQGGGTPIAGSMTKQSALSGVLPQ